jgi:hypothetical protein
MQKIVFYFCFFLILFQGNAQDTDKKMYFRGYSGGMMLHTGYISAQKNIKGMPWGIGGLIRLHWGNHFRTGGEGYNSTLHYGKNKSFLALSWGGLLMDCQWKIKKCTLFVGGTLGGGKVKNITVATDFSLLTQENATYRTYSVMLADPFMGMEYALTERFHFVTKIDYLFNITKKQPDFATGIRFYAGFVFFHERKK